MKISLIIISALLVLSAFLPFILFIYNGTKNTVSRDYNKGNGKVLYRGRYACYGRGIE